ncbi:MAG: hypothetical protein M3451_13110 [Chloroflexota bacterium]|nr:hypothetical protein [Chloroflexota bacterium]
MTVLPPLYGMTTLELFTAARPSLAVLAANTLQDLHDTFDDMPGLVSISAEVMSVPAMKSALDLPWNRAPGEVEDQLKLMISASSVPMATMLGHLKSSFRILEMNDRPRRGSEARRMALVCLIPVHLAPPSWYEIAGRPVALTVEIAAGE